MRLGGKTHAGKKFPTQRRKGRTEERRELRESPLQDHHPAMAGPLQEISRRTNRRSGAATEFSAWPFCSTISRLLWDSDPRRCRRDTFRRGEAGKGRGLVRQLCGTI